ncbi:hypothetical protein [Caldimonas brevitalea]|uniref:Uncharacterized protein n=1 Tax=Caldimonas brevitalea TaxID=413882 RepID=A0A0G3BP54_9BURK|nr:hypothetical protein [Caldimonas brevitalea]AKJ31187.1 hypothetical protein AAW51_4496 [Caldimonas brevitalea]
MATVYRKTDKGHAEIATRQNRLAMKLRTALIMVDGKRQDEELRRLIPGEAQEWLEILLAEGYIEVIAVTGGRSTSRPAGEEDLSISAFRPSSPPGGRPVDMLRLQAVRFMSEQLGPLGDSLSMRMEKARTWEELQPLLTTAHRIIADNRGGATAEAFKAAFLDSGA